MSARFLLAASLALIAACTPQAPAPTSTQLPSSPTPTPSPAAATFARSVTPSLVPTPTPTLTATGVAPATATPLAATSTPTPAPAATGTHTGELVVDETEIARHLDAIAAIAAANGDLRAAGLPGYDASADYVHQELAALGYSVTRDPFDFMFFDEAAPVELIVGDQTWLGAEWLHAMLYSAPGSAAGQLQPVSMDGEFSTGTGGCLPEDWQGFVAGRIALIGSGPCFRRDQVVNGQEAGAIAVISVYPRWEAGQARRPTLLQPEGITIPAIVAGREPMGALLAAAASGGTAQVTVERILEERSDDNVIAELPGTGEGVVMLGGHLDSVLDGPGINDNGSGVATLLAIAAALRNMAPPEATVRFGFWGAEEFGDLGSSAYVAALPQAERERIGAYLNLDMVGSVNAARLVYRNELSPPASYELTDALLAAFEELGAPAQEFDAGPSSDHFAFEQAGIAIGGVFSGLAPLSDEQAALFGGLPGVPADPCYHLSCDDRANVNTATAQLFGEAVAQVLRDLAY